MVTANCCDGSSWLQYMNLRDLRYLVALADCLSFSRAADECAVTQSTLSIQVRKLEEYLGVVLFERNRAHVALTAEGREIARHARAAIRHADEILIFSRHRTQADGKADERGDGPTKIVY